MFTYYNNQAIRKLVIGVGSLFNNIHILQKKEDGTNRDTLVPITYAPKEKFYKRLILPSSISDQTRVEINTPAIAFEITNMQYDPARKLNKLNKTNNTTYMEVPYNFTFGVYAYTRTIEENLQIMEQILPQFTPEFIISLNFTSVNTKVDVPIVLVQTNISQEYEGDFSTRRAIISSYQFIAKSYVYNYVSGISAPAIQTYSGLFDADNGITFGITGG